MYTVSDSVATVAPGHTIHVSMCQPGQSPIHAAMQHGMHCISSCGMSVVTGATKCNHLHCTVPPARRMACMATTNQPMPQPLICQSSSIVHNRVLERLQDIPEAHANTTSQTYVSAGPALQTGAAPRTNIAAGHAAAPASHCRQAWHSASQKAGTRGYVHALPALQVHPTAVHAIDYYSTAAA